MMNVRSAFIFFHLGLFISAIPVIGFSSEKRTTDICIYGGTASGVIAAIAATKEGSRVIIVEPSRWLGGMTGGGISQIDWGDERAVGGSTLKILKEGYNNSQYRKFFRNLLEENKIEVLYEHRLGSVSKKDAVITTVSFDFAPPDSTGCPPAYATDINKIEIESQIYIDCSYEGDLLAKSGVAYTFGRESREKYGESLAGVEPELIEYDIDPYILPGDPNSGLIPFVQDREIGVIGSADQLVMGYCLRYKFDLNGQGIPIPKPENYDPAQYELFRRGFNNGLDLHLATYMKKPGKIKTKKGYFISKKYPSGNTNRSILTTTVWGINTDYPEGDWSIRSKIWKFHQDYFKGVMYFLKTDSSVPNELKELVSTATFERGVFDDTGGWPHQLYVREARRMVSDYVLTQKDLEGKTSPKNSIGLASYGVDEWPYATYVKNGKVAISGGIYSELILNSERNGIYKIPYQAIVPKTIECTNLIVPVCVSASHIAMTSIRMEPVWMILGESAGVAAAVSVKNKNTVQEVDYQILERKLLALNQKLDL